MIGKELRKVVIGLIVLHAKKNIYIYISCLCFEIYFKS